MALTNPYHKSGNFGDGKISWNEHPEFQAWEEGEQAGIKKVVEVLRKIGWDRPADDVELYLGVKD